jgi:aminopeptidase YwaD
MSRRPEVVDRVRHHLRRLVVDVGARPPGSPANRRANAHLLEVLERAGLTVREDPFTTRWWEPGTAELLVAGQQVPVTANPYSPATEVRGAVCRLPADPSVAPPPGSVLLVGADLAPEPLFPAAFPFLSFPEHLALVERLVAARPAAVLTVSSGPPILEDPDLALPSLTIRPETADDLDGREVSVHIGGAVHEAEGTTVSARAGRPGPRIVVSAHVDSKATTPGAFDNAASVAALLAWVEAGLPEQPLEIAFFNGEDHADACGEQAWLAATDLAEVAANVNLDGVGVRGRRTSVAVLGGSPALEAGVDAFLAERPGWEGAAPWFESDHALFAMRGIPALALTCAGVHDLLTEVAHTPRDDLSMVDPVIVADAAAALAALVDVAAAR